MTSVQTNANSVFIIDQGYCVAKIFKSASQNIPSSSHILKKRDDSRTRLVGAIEIPSQMSNRSLTIAISRVRHARVEIVEFDTQFLASLEIVQEAIVRLLGAFLVRVGKIDQIRAVRHHVVRLTVGMGFAVVVEAQGVFVCQRWIGPFALGLEEESEGIRSDVDAVEDGVVHACGGSVMTVGMQLDYPLTTCTTHVCTNE